MKWKVNVTGGAWDSWGVLCRLERQVIYGSLRRGLLWPIRLCPAGPLDARDMVTYSVYLADQLDMRLSGLIQSEQLWEHFSNIAKTCIMQSSQQVKHDYKPRDLSSPISVFYLFQELGLTHSVEVASSVSTPTPDCGTISSSRADWGLSVPCLATWSSSETKNCGGNTECESRAYSKNRQRSQKFKSGTSGIRFKQWTNKCLIALWTLIQK